MVAPKDATKDAKASQKDNSQDTANQPADDKQNGPQDPNTGAAQSVVQASAKSAPFAAGTDFAEVWTTL